MGIKDFFGKIARKDEDIGPDELRKRGLLPEEAEKEPDAGVASDDSAESFIETASPGSEESPSNLVSGAGSMSSGISSSSGKEKLKSILQEMRDKVDNVSSKLYKFSDRIDLLERKIDRLERKIGIASEQA